MRISRLLRQCTISLHNSKRLTWFPRNGCPPFGRSNSVWLEHAPHLGIRRIIGYRSSEETVDDAPGSSLTYAPIRSPSGYFDGAITGAFEDSNTIYVVMLDTEIRMLPLSLSPGFRILI